MKMRPFKRLLSRHAAMEIIRSNIKPLDKVEKVSLEEAAGRVLAKDAVARFNVPPFNRASMDGYAVRAEDTYGASIFSPNKLIVLGEQHAGRSSRPRWVKMNVSRWRRAALSHRGATPW